MSILSWKFEIGASIYELSDALDELGEMLHRFQEFNSTACHINNLQNQEHCHASI